MKYIDIVPDDGSTAAISERSGSSSLLILTERDGQAAGRMSVSQVVQNRPLQ